MIVASDVGDAFLAVIVLTTVHDPEGCGVLVVAPLVHLGGVPEVRKRFGTAPAPSFKTFPTLSDNIMFPPTHGCCSAAQTPWAGSTIVKLTSLYASEAADELLNIRHQLDNLSAIAGSSAVKAQLIERATSTSSVKFEASSLC